ncbi:MAG TPA: RHS repeat domain-containing protein [Rhizomicrobium sp.]|nr:RHS repeat domain-containing protein [Rhizomicrobium sp.]
MRGGLLVFVALLNGAGPVNPVRAAGLLTTPTTGTSSVTYGYDPDGRIRSALYDNGLCITYTYDENGNRTSQTNTISTPAETAIWGSGNWGCFAWTAP